MAIWSGPSLSSSLSGTSQRRQQLFRCAFATLRASWRIAAEPARASSISLRGDAGAAGDDIPVNSTKRWGSGRGPSGIKDARRARHPRAHAAGGCARLRAADRGPRRGYFDTSRNPGNPAAVGFKDAPPRFAGRPLNPHGTTGRKPSWRQKQISVRDPDLSGHSSPPRASSARRTSATLEPQLRSGEVATGDDDVSRVFQAGRQSRRGVFRVPCCPEPTGLKSAA